MDQLTVVDTVLEIHPQRAEVLYGEGIIVKDSGHQASGSKGKWKLSEGMGASLRLIVASLLDLKGEHL